jgi:hypothetical protein
VQRQHKAWHFEFFFEGFEGFGTLDEIFHTSSHAILLLESLLKEHVAVALRTCIVETKSHCLDSGCGDLFVVE